jgi:predicted methyltransferase
MRIGRSAALRSNRARCGLVVGLLLACSPAPMAPPPGAASPPASPVSPPAPVPTDMPQRPGPIAPAPTIAAVSPDPRVDEQRSVHPGINAPYRARGAVRTWTRRFERDGREVHDHQAQIVGALELRPGMAIADVGAGTGLFTLAFAAAVGSGGTVYAVDVIPEFLAHIRDRARKAGLSQVQLVQATDRSAGLPPASVDLVFMSDAYHHLEYPQHVLATLHAALRPGGSLWVIDFQRDEHSSAATRRHVRAGKAQVLEELAQAGFVLVEELPLLQENYVLHLAPSG